MVQFEKPFVQNLTQDIKVRQCGTIVFNNDNLSNVVSVALYNGEEAYTGGGTVVGAVICPDGATVALDGTLSGNVASIILTGDCFALQGQIGVSIQIVSGDVRTTVLKAIYNVDISSTDTIVDPGSRITLSLAEIEAKLDEIPTILSEAQAAVDGIEAQKDTMIASIASVAGQGTDTTLTQSGVAADAKAAGDQISDLKSASVEVVPKVFDDVSNYNTTVAPSVCFVSDHVIGVGSYIKCVRYYVTQESDAWIYVIDNTTKNVMKRVIIDSETGWNVAPINYYCASDVVIGLFDIYTARREEFASSPSKNKSGFVFSTGKISASPTMAVEGDTLTLTTTDTNIVLAYPVQFVYDANPSIATWDNTINHTPEDEMENVWDRINAFDEITPTVYEDYTKYTTAAPANGCYFSDRILTAGAYLNGVRIYGKTASASVYIYLMDNTTHRIINCAITPVAQGWNVISLNWQISTDSVLGFYGNVFNYTLLSHAQMISDPLHDYAFSDGFHESSNTKQFAIGDIVSDYTSYLQGRNLLMPVQWLVSTAQLAVGRLSNDTKIHHHGCIVSIIDDDCGVNVPEIWDGIFAETGIKIGFACVTGIMSGDVTPSTSLLTPMSLEQLKAYYNAGHEVYSHSYSHPAFYDASTTEAEIATQCVKSRSWLGEQGFDRASDIIVYPGGLGITKTGKQDVIRRFYRWGVDTVIGDGINDEPIYNPYAIHRINGDTSTLAQLKAVVDKAIATNKILVLMCHAYELIQDKNAQIAKLTDFIEYAQESGATFIPLGEALHYVYGW